MTDDNKNSGALPAGGAEQSGNTKNDNLKGGAQQKDGDRAAAFFTKGWVVCIGAIICCILWGSAFPCVKIG